MNVDDGRKVPRTCLPSRPSHPHSAALAPTGRGKSWALRQAREPGKIRRALLQEGIPSLLALFSHVEEHRCITGQLLNTRQTIGVCIEGRFQEAQRKRAFLQYLLCPLDSLFFQAFQRYYSVNQSHIQGLLGGVLPAEIPDLT